MAPMTSRLWNKILIPLSMLFTITINAQQMTHGKVISADNQQPLAGATVLVKGTSKQTATDNSGAFHIESAAEDILVVSSVGFSPLEVKAGDANYVLMNTTTKNMTEVVVTALGIRREEKSLGYAAQKLNEGAVKDAKTNNWVNALSGKVAGLNIQGTGSGPMGSSRITLRGESSLNLDNNQALIIIDGVPVSSKITGTGYKAHLAADSPVDFGSDVSDINPDDIDKITILKGPGATALYGSRAAGGAIIITTKSGERKDKGIGVT
jgi:TonB-dependent SusC/RagA subfamily outer membrane receptor